ncbi:DUF3313 family protein [Novosphingobium sp. AP12]|uniref:DUF3313 family protein n=1 Tax=Novosphingobium sp. AP12 TaxID=1144305 RepID=UPI000271F5D0|nr:DUF3313 family protein [Novosphingobium sp. AP12]EJL34164.1 Protein of unknown function (DUF3313) [Novosphingobium sp. AP12]
MRTRQLSRAIVLPLLLMAATPAFSAKAPDTWDGLLHVPSKKMGAVYLQANADFRVYSKVMLDPTQIAFRKNWERDHNTLSAMGSISNEQAQRILDQAKAGFQKLFVDAYQKAGYEVVQQGGPGVLRVATAVVDLDVTSPDTMSAGRTWTFSKDAGSATLVLEARDSQTGAILGRAVDKRALDDVQPYIRNSVTNGSEFEQLFASWAKKSAAGLGELKALSPVNVDGMRAK